MIDSFPHTARQLLRDSARGSRVLMLLAVLGLAAWSAWFTKARVPLYASSEHARLEVRSATVPVDVPVAGRVTAVRLALDSVVEEGDVLVELDATAQNLALAEARSKVEGVNLEIAATESQIAIETRALEAFRLQLGAATPEAESRVREAEIQTQAALVEADREKRLFAETLATESDLLRARAEAQRLAASEAAIRATVGRLERESSTGARDRESRIATLRRETARLVAELGPLDSTVRSLQYEIGRRTVRAPSRGRVGELGEVRVGSVLAVGDHIATIVAGGDLRVVASFEPATLGRVHPGQAARIALDGFPVNEYGAVPARVTNVATELRDSKVRIELTVTPSASSRIPLQHGLPGIVEITVDEVSPATLVLRAAGRP